MDERKYEYEIRRKNLKALMDDRFGTGRGAQTRMAEVLGRSQNYMSRLLSPTGSKNSKNIGEVLAREFEKLLGLEKHTLDDPNLPRKYEFFAGPQVGSIEGNKLAEAAGDYCEIDGTSPLAYRIIELDRRLLSKIIESLDNACDVLDTELPSNEKADAISGVYARAKARGMTANTYDPEMMAVAILTIRDRTAPQ